MENALADAASWRLLIVTGADARIPAVLPEAESLGFRVWW